MITPCTIPREDFQDPGKQRKDLQSIAKILETFAWNLHVRGNARMEIQVPESLSVFLENCFENEPRAGKKPH